MDILRDIKSRQNPPGITVLHTQFFGFNLFKVHPHLYQVIFTGLGLLRHPLSLSLRDRDRKLKRTNHIRIKDNGEQLESPHHFDDEDKVMNDHGDTNNNNNNTDSNNHHHHNNNCNHNHNNKNNRNRRVNNSYRSKLSSTSNDSIQEHGKMTAQHTLDDDEDELFDNQTPVCEDDYDGNVNDPFLIHHDDDDGNDDDDSGEATLNDHDNDASETSEHEEELLGSTTLNGDIPRRPSCSNAHKEEEEGRYQKVSRSSVDGRPDSPVSWSSNSSTVETFSDYFCDSTRLLVTPETNDDEEINQKVGFNYSLL